MASFTLNREIAAPPEVVFDLLTEHRGYVDLTPLRKVELEREGDPAPNGVGAIRVLHLVGPPLREEVLVYERPSRFSYTVLSGLPVRDHVGTVDLAPTPAGGTAVVYAVRTNPAVPVLGRLAVTGTRIAVGRLLDAIAAEAERRAAGAAV